MIIRNIEDVLSKGERGMKGFYPLKSKNVCYLYICTDREEFVYVLPDGRVASAPKDYFSELNDLDEALFTVEQKKINALSHLTPSFIKFITSLEQRLLTKDSDETLGGDSKIFFLGKAQIQDKSYTLEVHKKTDVNSLKNFIEDLYKGEFPNIAPQSKSKNVLCLQPHGQEKAKMYPNLHIYSK